MSNPCNHRRKLFYYPTSKQITKFRLWFCEDCGNYVSLLPRQQLDEKTQEERRGDWGDYHDAMSGRF